MACFHDASQLACLDTSRYCISSKSRRHSGSSVARKYQQRRANYVLASSSGKEFSSSLDPVLERTSDSQASSSSEDADSNIEEGCHSDMESAAGSLVGACMDLASENTTSNTVEDNVVVQVETVVSTATAFGIEDQPLQMELAMEENDAGNDSKAGEIENSKRNVEDVPSSVHDVPTATEGSLLDNMR